MARSNKDAFVAILRDIARQVAALDDAEFEDVTKGTAKIQISVQGRRSGATTKQTKAEKNEFSELIAKLKVTMSREEGERLIDEAASSKDELTRLARCIDVPVRKGDQVNLIKSRVIEATIGFRLSSAAIQGSADHDPKEDSSQ